MTKLTLGVLAAGLGVGALVAGWQSGWPKTDVTWLPYFLLVLGVVGLATGVFETNPRFDPKAGVRTQVLLLLLGPTGYRFAFAVMGGALAGGGLGLLLRT